MPHAHDRETESGEIWDAWSSGRARQLVYGLLALAAIATVVGLVIIWPTASGTADAVANASAIGAGAELIEAQVIAVSDEACSYSSEADPQSCRLIAFRPESGPDAGEILSLPELNLNFAAIAPNMEAGDGIVVSYEPQTEFYSYSDFDRSSSLLWLGLAFVVVVVALGRARGVTALLAMGLTVVVLVGLIAPSVLDGNDPVLVAVVGAALIAFASLYLTHGFSTSTSVALLGTLSALALTFGLTFWVFDAARFTGLASEEGLLLPLIAQDLSVSSLLLGGAVIGALGALDDVTVTQVATVAELRRRRPDLSAGELITSGIKVGREHIASTVNTLLLAYAGASLPLLLLFAASDQPLGLIASSEIVAVEIARTLTGSIGLVAAVPLTTILAAVTSAAAKK